MIRNLLQMELMFKALYREENKKSKGVNNEEGC